MLAPGRTSPKFLSTTAHTETVPGKAQIESTFSIYVIPKKFHNKLVIQPPILNQKSCYLLFKTASMKPSLLIIAFVFSLQ